MRANVPRISASVVASLPDGQMVKAWTLTGSGGLTFQALNYGGIVTRLLVPDRRGQLDDVVLGFDRIDSYFEPHPYFGAIVGRVAGRLTGASFSVDGRAYQLSANEGANHLHGGFAGFDKKLWTAAVLNREDGSPSLQLSYLSPAGEEGYPGQVQADINYTVLADNTFQIDTRATTDAATPFSPTHHSYFNLGGKDADLITDHELQVHSDRVSAVGDQLLHVGKLISVTSQANDFNQPRLMRDALANLPAANGDLYLIRKTSRQIADQELVAAATVSHSPSGRRLTVCTNEPYLQLYTSSAFDGSLVGKSGRGYPRHAGLCLECQGHPNSPNDPPMGDIILRPGQIFHRTTQYTFSTF